MFFDLNVENKSGTMNSLRQLQDHFIQDDDPLSFSDYRQNLSNIYMDLKSKLFM